MACSQRVLLVAMEHVVANNPDRMTIDLTSSDVEGGVEAGPRCDEFGGGLGTME